MDKLEKSIKNHKRQAKEGLKRNEKPKVQNLLDKAEDEVADGIQYEECKICGKVFAQNLTKSGNYTTHKTCPACRWQMVYDKKESAPKTEKTDVVYADSLLYKPYDWQKRFHTLMQTHRFGIVSAGARTGKDYCFIMQAFFEIEQLANENRLINNPTMVPSYRIWIVGPTDDILNQNWEQIKKFIPRSFLPRGNKSIKDSERKIELIQGGLLEVRSAYNEDYLVGVGVDFCVITEAARIKKFETVWRNIEGRLMSPGAGIRGKGGRCIVNSSPRGKNYFHKIWSWGQKNHPYYDSQFFSLMLSTDENPTVKKEMDEIVVGFNGVEMTRREQLRRRWGDKAFAQDYLGEFVDSGGVVFPDFKENCTYNPFYELKEKSRAEILDFIKEWKQPKPGERYRVGYDPASGSSSDFPVIVIRELKTNRIVMQLDMYGQKDDAQLDTVAYWCKQYNYAECCVLTLGNMLVAGQLRNRGIDVKEVGEQGFKKRMLVQSLQRATQNREIMVLDDGSAEVEKLIFQMEDYTEAEGTGKFSNVIEPNDDYVSALYACYSDYSETPEVKKHYTGMMSGIYR